MRCQFPNLCRDSKLYGVIASNIFQIYKCFPCVCRLSFFCSTSPAYCCFVLANFRPLWILLIYCSAKWIAFPIYCLLIVSQNNAASISNGIIGGVICRPFDTSIIHSTDAFSILLDIRRLQYQPSEIKRTNEKTSAEITKRIFANSLYATINRPAR